MKQLFLLLFALLQFSIFAQVEAPVLTKKERQNLKNNLNTKALLWKIEGKKIKKPSYVYGTIHMIPKEDFFWPNNTQKCIDECERLTLEIDMAGLENDMSAQMSMMMNIFMKDGVTLPKLLTEEEYKMVQDHFANGSLPLPQMMLDKIKPMFLSMMVSEDFDFMGGGLLGGGEEEEDSKDSMGGISSYEVELMDIAKKNEMETSGLETVEYQMSVFDSIPYKDQADMLIDAIVAEKDTTTNIETQMADMIQLYKDQDLQALQQLLKTESSGMEQFEEILLNQRNRNWIPIMKTQIAEKPTFFAVGAGHLGGPEGILTLLRQEGYKLTPVSMVLTK
jgi:uncharacterized protein YbaP (TraB family)